MTPCIAIIENDFLASAGLRVLLEDMFVGGWSFSPTLP